MSCPARHAVTLPLATHMARITVSSGAVGLTVLTTGWPAPDRERVHFDLFAAPETPAQLRRIADALESAMAADLPVTGAAHG